MVLEYLTACQIKLYDENKESVSIIFWQLAKSYNCNSILEFLTQIC